MTSSPEFERKDVKEKLRCGKCGRRIGVYLDEVSGRYLAHRLPLAFHRATLPDVVEVPEQQSEPSDAQVEAARVVLRDAWHFTPDVVREALRAAMAAS